MNRKITKFLDRLIKITETQKFQTYKNCFWLGLFIVLLPLNINGLSLILYPAIGILLFNMYQNGQY